MPSLVGSEMCIRDRPSLVNIRAPVIEAELNRRQPQNVFRVASSHSVSRATAIPQSSVQRHKLSLYPYKLQVNQHLAPRDKAARVEFANFILGNSVNLESVLWTDESYFSLSGLVHVIIPLYGVLKNRNLPQAWTCILQKSVSGLAFLPASSSPSFTFLTR